jgi:hypothetical protein
MKQRIRILNEAGIHRFRAWLQGGGVGEPPFDCLLDPETTDVLPGAGEVEQQDFTSRYELATHVLSALQDCDFNRINYAAGLWAWLSLFYVDFFCPVDRQGHRTVLELPRYLLTPEYRNYYRHLIREAVILVRKNGEYSRALLTSRTGRFRISSVFEEVASRQDLISNPGVVELVWRLYFNPKRKTIRVGVAGQGRAGGIRRFAVVLQQLSLNYDLPALTARQIADLLPREFEPWKRRANWEPIAAPGRSRGPGPRVQFDNIVVGSQWRRSQLTELWGYGDRHALRTALIAPRGQDLLILFITGGDEPAAEPVIATPERSFLWKEAIPRPTVRRLTRAAKDETPVHLFRRSQGSTAFVYMGRSHVGTLTACTDGAYEVEFRLLKA